MTTPKFVERSDEQLYAKLRDEAREAHAHGHDHPAPEEFSASPLHPHAPVCEMCHTKVFECRPFGPNHESICADCAAKDPEMTELRWRGLNPNG